MHPNQKTMKKNPRLFIEIILILFLSGILFYSCSTTSTENPDKPYVVMLSLDGFRWDYPDMIPTPNLDYIASKGVKAESLKPSYPTKTFPNHYTMATGLYPDHHGIVMNSFYDPEQNRYYAIHDRETVTDGTFYNGEPIWNTAEKQSVISASYFWVGSEADIQGMHPTYWKPYDHDFPFEQRLDSVIAWLQLPAKVRPHLILWYMHDPDDIGHRFGPASEELVNKVIYLDSLVGVFIRKIEALPIAGEINMIVTSDHGMCPNDSSRLVTLNQHVDEEWITEVQGYNPNYTLQVKDGYLDEAYESLEQVEHIQVWKHGEVPEKLHYGHNPRTLDLIIVADSAWSVRWEEGKFYSKGTHGYDNDNTDMHAIFYAMGPAFRQNHVHPTFNNIDLYPLIANILNLNPAPVDGVLCNTEGMLVE